jgi:hypothetical protein
MALLDLRATSGLLTGPSNSASGIAADRLASASRSNPEIAARPFIGSHGQIQRVLPANPHIAPVSLARRPVRRAARLGLATRQGATRGHWPPRRSAWPSLATSLLHWRTRAQPRGNDNHGRRSATQGDHT